MLINIYEGSLPSPRTVATPSQSSVVACREIPAKSSQVQVHRSLVEALQNDLQITAYCAIWSCIYGHILVLNLHSICATHLGKTPLLFRFLTYYVYLPTCLWSSCFLTLAPLFVFCFFVNLVCLFPHIYYICVYFKKHRFNYAEV
jgi:intracellular septation protein A